MAKSALERVARALCRREGHPENITFEGKPMWRSYIDQAGQALEAAQVTPLVDLLLAVATDERVPADLRGEARKVVASYGP